MPTRFNINLPPLTRILFLANLAFSVLNAILRFRSWTASLPSVPASQLAQQPANYLSDPRWAVPFLALVPIRSIRYPWTFATAAVIENNVVSLAISASVIWFGGRYLERAWGGTEFAKFLLVACTIPNLLTFCVYAIWHASVRTPDFPTPIQGLLALEAGFLVSLKQLVPEHTVSLFRNTVRVRIKHFPAIFTLANIVSGPLLGTWTALWLSLFGFLTSWIYLRFYRITELTSTATGESAKMRGDASDTFSFVAFFPDGMHPFLAPLCDSIYALLVQLNVCTPFSEDAIDAGNENVAARSEGGLPSIMNHSSAGSGGRRAEAERRRALALKALDQRLNAAAANRAGSAPVASAALVTASDTVPDAAVGASAEPSQSPVAVKEAQA
ncbi:hypothetical protein BAUCODRAFT_35143 [Baudoinia panamericana UAMH 10762]|uniref:Peptidase S54 rhomboid domain-containing protein n=1 Tax=Baudoinia panamericana (strain UAMH 10762) TaxID=717646 RepID=M2MEX4_BAUPA|nr:uncharacterized protein BAUCODRAFT_35143 [Baudoinia panamericana UAMH 10762]EMC95151.1 hypothetical protein BAUCODRAFT_35143 [Baudoinia panamericana UAMH 10762]